MNNRIKEARKEAKITQKDLAQKLNLSRSYYVQVENGKENPSERTIKDICRELNVRYEWLVYGDGPKRSEEDNKLAIIDSVMASENEFVRNTLIALASLEPKYWDMIKEITEELLKNQKK